MVFLLSVAAPSGRKAPKTDIAGWLQPDSLASRRLRGFWLEGGGAHHLDGVAMPLIEPKAVLEDEAAGYTDA